MKRSALESLFNKNTVLRLVTLLKKTPVQVLFWGFCKKFKEPLFYRTPLEFFILFTVFNYPVN